MVAQAMATSFLASTRFLSPALKQQQQHRNVVVVSLQQQQLVKQWMRNAAFGVCNFAMVSLPTALAIASEKVPKEKGKIFDFDLTLPIMAGQFLLLMVALDKLWFTPVGNFMDERDEMIRKLLEGVKDTSEEIKALQDEAEAIIQAARAEVTAELNKMKRETAAELDAQLQESRQRIDQELAQALANLEEKKQEMLRSLETQVQELSDKIVDKLLPLKA